ncbi:uncharacterized protein LOC132796896 [Drosophila nasuta]|uniref:uncharacterized protein LOC132796896 n=1 Tax=Drosophila nasuta TaxID=42062 RepID=UPI00295F4F83|nr:uncharacterized protein LOC132796896 [Drosophila nasuta]
MNPTGPNPDFSDLGLDLEGQPINNIVNNVNGTSEDDPSRGSHLMDFLSSLEFNDQGQTGNNIVSNSTIDYSTYDSRVQDVNEMLAGDFTWGGECFFDRPPEFEFPDPFATNIVAENGNQPEEYHNYQTQLADFNETFDENLMWESLNLMELPPNFEIKDQIPTEYNIDTVNVKQPIENSTNDGQLQEEMLWLSQNLTSTNDGQLQEEMQNLTSSYKMIDAEQFQNNNVNNSPIQNTISEAQLQTVNDVTLTEENLINQTPSYKINVNKSPIQNTISEAQLQTVNNVTLTEENLINQSPSYKINDQENVEMENNIITKLSNDNTSSEYQLQNDGTFGEDLSVATQNLNELTSSNDPKQTENNGVIMFPIYNTSLTSSSDPEQMENTEVIMFPTDNTIDEAQVPEENVMNPSHILIDLTPSFVINDPRISTEIGTIFDLPIQYTSEQIMNMEVVLWEDMFPNVPSNFGQTD